MNDYFTNVVAKALSAAPVVRPRLASWFGVPGPNPAEVSAEQASGRHQPEQSPSLQRAVGEGPIDAKPSSAATVNIQLKSPASTMRRAKMLAAEAAPPPWSETHSTKLPTSGDAGPHSRMGSAAGQRSSATQSEVPHRFPGELDQGRILLQAAAQKRNAPASRKNVFSLHAGNERTQPNGTEEKPSDKSRPSETEDLSWRQGIARLSRAPHAVSTSGPAAESTEAFVLPAEKRDVTVQQQTAPQLQFPLRHAPPGAPFGRTGEAAQNTIQVSIGRIEVRATPAPRSRNERQSLQSPGTLEQYLNRRSGAHHE
jgi:hypothetical protein